MFLYYFAKYFFNYYNLFLPRPFCNFYLIFFNAFYFFHKMNLNSYLFYVCVFFGDFFNFDLNFCSYHISFDFFFWIFPWKDFWKWTPLFFYIFIIDYPFFFKFLLKSFFFINPSFLFIKSQDVILRSNQVIIIFRHSSVNLNQENYLLFLFIQYFHEPAI